MKKFWKIFWLVILILVIFSVGFIAYNFGVDKGKNEKEVFPIIQNDLVKEGRTTNISIDVKRDMPTRWDLLDLPYFSQQFPDGTNFVDYETNIYIKCENDTIVTDKYLTYQFPFTCSSGKIKISIPPQYLAQLSREGLTPLKLIATYDFNEYGSEYEWKEFEI